MNYDVSSETIAVRNLVFEGCQENPIDMEFSLPDYCPDIQKILKCQVRPSISARNISGDRLNIDGTINIRMIYLDSDRMSVRLCENSSPFSCSIDIRSAPENAVAVTSCRLEYVNCRAVSPRKVDVHGAFAICTRVYNKDSMDIACCVNGNDIQQKLSDITASNLCGIGQQQFSINESLDLGQGKPVPELIIRSDASLIMDEYKTLVNKVIVKGEALIKILYMSDMNSGQLETMEYSVPVSQVVDVPGAAEGCRCVINAEILGHDEQVQSDGQEGLSLISTDIKIAVAVAAYVDKEIAAVTDIYSTLYDVEHSHEIVRLCRLCDTVKDTFSAKACVDLPETKISRVIDVWSDTSSMNCKYQGDKLVFDGKMNMCILAIDLEGIPFYIERVIEIGHTKDFSSLSEDITAECTVVPISIGYRITSNDSIEIKSDVKLFADIYCCERLTMVTGASADENQPKLKDTDAALTIYYADGGETVWDIARRYYTCVEAVKKENDMDTDVIERDGMLLIPMK